MTRRILAALACAWLLAVAAPGRAFAEDAREKQARAHARQAKAFFDAGDYPHAIEEYQAAYELDHKPTRLYNLAVCHERAGDRARALELYRRYLDVEPAGEAAELARQAIASLEDELARAQQRQREAEAAQAQQRADAAAAARRAEDQAQAREHAARADGLVRGHAYAAAAEELLAAYALDPSQPELLWQAAQAYRLAGDRARAAEQYGRYLAAAPSGAHAAPARQQLAQLTSGTIAPPPPPKPKPKPAASRRSPWLWPTLAGTALLTGIMLDNFPASAHNGKRDAADYLPVGCYALGVTFVAVWAF